MKRPLPRSLPQSPKVSFNRDLVLIFIHSCLFKGKARGTPGGGNGPGGGNTKRRTHADNIPDSEKPFSCERKYTEL